MPLTTERAKRLVEAHFDGSWSCRTFGSGKFSDTFLAECAGREIVLRVAPPDSLLQLFYEYRMMRQEPGIHRRLLQETSVPVPGILAYDFTRARIDRDFLFMERLEGEPLDQAILKPSARQRALREWGAYVAEIHSLHEPKDRYGYVGEHECMEPCSTWSEAFREMYSREMKDICSCGIYDERQAQEALDLLDDHLSLFSHCQSSRLCHGDLWVTNLLVDSEGGVTGVIDFDRACWGDIEWDLAIADYCGVTTDPFWHGYGKRVENQRGDAAIRRFFYLLYEHQKYIVISISERRNDPTRAARYADESLRAMESFRKTGRPAF